LHVWPCGQPFPPMPRQPSMHVSIVVSQTLPLIVPPQSMSVRHCTQACDPAVSQTGSGAAQSVLVAHGLTVTTVGGLPAVLPLPSVTHVLTGAPSAPPAWTLAWFATSPVTPEFTVTWKLTTVVAPEARS